MSRSSTNLSASPRRSPASQCSPVNLSNEQLDELSDDVTSCDINGDQMMTSQQYLRPERKIIIKESRSADSLTPSRVSRRRRNAAYEDEADIKRDNRSSRHIVRNQQDHEQEEIMPNDRPTRRIIINERKSKRGEELPEQIHQSTQDEIPAHGSEDRQAVIESRKARLEQRRKASFEGRQLAQTQAFNESNKTVRKEFQTFKHNAYLEAKEKLQSIVPPPTRKYPLFGDTEAKKYELYKHVTGKEDREGVKVIPQTTPGWKVPLLQKKNRQVIDEYLEQKAEDRKILEAAQIEEEKWNNVPEWMRPLVRERTRQKHFAKIDAYNKVKDEQQKEEEFLALPPWQKELVLRKKEKARLDTLPDWQKELIQKKKVASTKKTFE